ncbi:hypothetical protein CEXT_374261 [Caerostris extrusa]|uniref:Uncharacterized protein n=1 Tax=Caerostris extrusa TaxID=172846 RepID=A0AAV4NJ45_CAEEX|nr:hypothetical protein CEXT_374261 [Caerostris extrusa]
MVPRRRKFLPFRSKGLNSRSISRKGPSLLDKSILEIDFGGKVIRNPIDSIDESHPEFCKTTFFTQEWTKNNKLTSRTKERENISRNGIPDQNLLRPSTSPDSITMRNLSGSNPESMKTLSSSCLLLFIIIYSGKSEWKVGKKNFGTENTFGHE